MGKRNNVSDSGDTSLRVSKDLESTKNIPKSSVDQCLTYKISVLLPENLGILLMRFCNFQLFCQFIDL